MIKEDKDKRTRIDKKTVRMEKDKRTRIKTATRIKKKIKTTKTTINRSIKRMSRNKTSSWRNYKTFRTIRRSRENSG
jgi:hypothetical protein